MNSKLKTQKSEFKTSQWSLIIDGKKVSSSSGKTFAVINPATEEVIALVPEATTKDVDRAVAAAKAALEGPWGKLSSKERARLLFQFAATVRQHTEELALLESTNVGKPIRDARDEAKNVGDSLEYYAGAISKYFGETIPVADKGLNFTLREPIGVCALIVPWNYPMVIATWKLAPALACGNTVVLKPASLTPLTALRLGELALEAGLPNGVVNVIAGPGSVVGARLAEHPDVSKISFTGETATGAQIMRLASNTIKRVSLELGGKSANLIFADCDLDKCVESSIFSVFSNTGQDCCARSRILVEHAIYEKFLDKFVNRTKKIRVGNPLDTTTEVGPMVSKNQKEKVLEYILTGEDAGAKKLTGGTPLTLPSEQRLRRPRCRELCERPPARGEGLKEGKSKGYYLAPCVLDQVKPSMRVFKEEIFGPVVCVTPFKTEDQATELANNSIYGLSGSIWTSNVTRALRVAKAVKTGNLSINTSHSVHLEAPFGGVKQSGLGRELGMKAMDTYSEIKNVFISVP